jgi:hypothetical protein
MLVFKKKQLQLRKREEKENIEEYFIYSFMEMIKQGQFKKLKRTSNILFQFHPPLLVNRPKNKTNPLYTYISMSDFTFFNNVQLDRILISMKEEKEEKEEVYISYFIILIIQSIYTPEILKLFINLKNKCIKNLFLFDWIQLIKEKKIRFHGENSLERTLNDHLEKERIKLKMNKEEIQMEFNYLKENVKEWNEEYLKFISTNKEWILLDSIFIQRMIDMFEKYGLSMELKESMLMDLMNILIQNVKELKINQMEQCYSVLKRIFLKWYYHRVSGKSFEFLGHLSDSLPKKYSLEMLNLFSNFLKKKTPLFLWNDYLKGLLLFCKRNTEISLDYSLLLNAPFSNPNEQLLHSSLIYKFFYHLNNEKEMKPLLLERKKNYLFIFIISSFIHHGSLNYFNFIGNHYFHPNSVEMIGICNCIEKIPYQYDLFKQWIHVILKIIIYEMFDFNALESSSRMKDLILKKKDLFFQYQGIFPNALSILSMKDVDLVEIILNESFSFLKKVNENWNNSWKKNNEKIFSFLRSLFPTFHELFSQLNIQTEEEKLKGIHSLSYLEFIKDKSMIPLLKKWTGESSSLPKKILSNGQVTMESTSRLYFYLNYFLEFMSVEDTNGSFEMITFLFQCLDEQSEPIILKKVNDLFLKIKSDEMIPYYLQLCIKRGGILYSLFLKYFPLLMENSRDEVSIHSVEQISTLFQEKLKKNQISKSLLILLLNMTQTISLNVTHYFSNSQVVGFSFKNNSRILSFNSIFQQILVKIFIPSCFFFKRLY